MRNDTSGSLRDRGGRGKSHTLPRHPEVFQSIGGLKSWRAACTTQVAGHTMPSALTFVRWFNQVTLGDVPLVGLTKGLQPGNLADLAERGLAIRQAIVSAWLLDRLQRPDAAHVGRRPRIRDRRACFR